VRGWDGDEPVWIVHATTIPRSRSPPVLASFQS
jgi:hypothetical protein